MDQTIKIPKEEMLSIVERCAVAAGFSVKESSYSKYEKDRPKLSICRYSERLKKDMPFAAIRERWIATTLAEERWDYTFMDDSGTLYELRIPAECPQDFISACLEKQLEYEAARKAAIDSKSDLMRLSRPDSLAYIREWKIDKLI